MRSPGKTWQAASVVLVILAIALQWYAHQEKLLLTSDSCNYLSASVSFKNTWQFLSYDGSPYTYWPPLFPIILSVFSQPADVFYWIHMVITAWIGILFVVETRRFIQDPLLQTLCQAVVLLGVHLLLIGVFLWTELLFLLILFYFIKAVPQNFVATIALGFFLCLLRNAGLFFVIAAVLCYGKDLRRSIALFVLSTSGFFAWNVWNAMLGGHEYFMWVVPNFNLMAWSMLRAFAPVPVFFLFNVIAAMVFILIVGAMAWLLRNELKTNQALRVWSVMIVVYLVGIASLFQLDFHDGDRYAALVLPFFTIIIFRALEIAGAKQTSGVRILLLVMAVCWLVYPLSRTIKNALQWHEVSFTSTCNNYK
jgi:hypothetical protein